ncbi:hypothetical protein EDD18DRAFT_1185506 [Armillaria luteobubalina]|uniref:Uncharacterized protein n=1 Tax=Armillaria luteobubalina TaxID=153913 RepID=A0AA39PYC0_9AGAR|nr:hypothetical protein EDD18DRAFT_1185506 [Armillaria luteobubalina]
MPIKLFKAWLPASTITTGILISVVYGRVPCSLEMTVNHIDLNEAIGGRSGGTAIPHDVLGIFGVEVKLFDVSADFCTGILDDIFVASGYVAGHVVVFPPIEESLVDDAILSGQ